MHNFSKSNFVSIQTTTTSAIDWYEKAEESKMNCYESHPNRDIEEMEDLRRRENERLQQEVRTLKKRERRNPSCS